MKIFKIILALLLIYGIGEEYINASKQLFSFFDPGILAVVFLMLAFCTWLLGSGISNEKFQLKSWQFFKYFGLTFVMFILVALVSLATFKFPPEILNVNGMNVDIAEFMNGSKKIIPDEKQRRQYCICVVTKLTADKELADQYRTEFESGKFSNAIVAIQNGPNADKYRLQECAGSVTDVQWTPDFEKGVRRNLMKQLTELQISSTNDITIYCECLIEEYKKIPISELTSGEFPNSLNGMKIDSICNLRSKLK